MTKNRLGVFCFPEGLSYADRSIEVHGDYKKLGFLGFKDLKLEIYPGCPAFLREQIEADAARIQAKRGQEYQTSSSGQTITLGYALKGAKA
jgi:hypothetical protein